MNPSQRVFLYVFSVIGFLVTGASAEPVRLFFNVGPTTFEVKQFHEGVPVLDTPVDTDIERHRLAGGWSYAGELPADPEFMAIAFNYTLQKIPRLYTNRANPPEYRVHFSFPETVKSVGKSSGEELAVLGWQVGGELRSFVVAPVQKDQRIKAQLSLNGTDIDPSGMLVAWIIDETGNLQPIDRSNEFDEIRLRIATVNGDLDTLVRLIEKNPKLLKYKTDSDRTLMMLAANGGRANVVKYLLEQGANPFLEDDRMSNVLDIAGEGGWIDIVKMVAAGKSKGSKQKLHYSLGALNAFNNGHQEVAIHLLERGAALNLNNKSAPGKVLALLANERVKLARWVQEEFNVDGSYTDNGVNFMHAVAGYADSELLEATRAGGASATGVSSKGVTPLLVASGVGNREAICWFMENGGTAEESGGSDPVLYAIREGAPESVSCLIEYGVNVNKEEKEGLSPLMYAASLGEREIAETLIEAGGVWLFDSQYSDFALQRAIRLNSPMLLEALFQQGLSPKYEFPNGVGLDEFAAFFEADTVLSLLKERTNGEGVRIVGVRDLAAKPEFAYRTALDYPVDFQEKYGDLDVPLKLGIARSGDVMAVEIGEDIPKEVRMSLERTIREWRFKPLAMDSDQLLAQMKFNIPLRVSFREEDIFDLRSVDQMPRSVRQFEPNYPFELKLAKVNGFVEAEWIIDDAGTVRRIRVVNSTHRAFEAPTIESIKRSTWEPAIKGGKPVAVKVVQRMVFNP